MSTYVVVITGASGSAYGMRAVEQLLVSGHGVVLVVTHAGVDVMEFELGFRLPEAGPREAVLRFLELDEGSPLRVAQVDDLFDPIASGSSGTDGVVVIPASMGFVGSVASGTAADLAERAADVALKSVGRW